MWWTDEIAIRYPFEFKLARARMAELFDATDCSAMNMYTRWRRPIRALSSRMHWARDQSATPDAPNRGCNVRSRATRLRNHWQLVLVAKPLLQQRISNASSGSKSSSPLSRHFQSASFQIGFLGCLMSPVAEAVRYEAIYALIRRAPDCRIYLMQVLLFISNINELKILVQNKCISKKTFTSRIRLTMFKWEICTDCTCCRCIT